MKKMLVLFVCMLMQLYAIDPVSTPITLSSESANSSDPQVVLDFEGTATALWLEEGVVKVNYLPLGGSWGTAEAISGSSCSQPKIVVDASGNLTVIWIESGVLTTVNKPFGGSWSSASAISSSGASNPGLTVGSTGNLVAVWERGGYIESVTKLFGQSWGSTDVLSLNSGADFPCVATGGDQVVVVWHEVVSSVDTILAATKTFSTSWNTPEEISANGIGSISPKVAVDSNGNAIAMWYHFTEAASQYSVGVSSVELPFAGSWGTPTVVFVSESIDYPSNLSIQVFFDSQGTAIAIWMNLYEGSAYALYSSIKKAGHSWKTPVKLAANNVYAYAFDMAVNPNDSVVAAYMSYDPYTSAIGISGAASYIEAYDPNDWLYVPSITTTDINGYPNVATNKISDLVYHIGVWLYYDGNYALVQTSFLGYEDLMPATNLQITQSSQDFGIFTEYYNTITWDASVTADVTTYYVLREGVLIGVVDSSEQLQFIDHNREQGGSDTYSVAAINSVGWQSAVVTANYP